MKRLLIALCGAFLGFVGCACAVSWSAKDFSDIKGTQEKVSVLIIGANGSVALSDSEFNALQNALDNIVIHGHRGIEETEQNSFGNKWKNQKFKK